MDLCADMLGRHLRGEPGLGLSAADVCPAFRSRLQRLPWVGRHIAFNGDRLLNRHWDYSVLLRRKASDFDYFHVCDHSYAQLVHSVPPERTGVYCHDLDAFRCLLEPAREPRPRWFRALARRVLAGLQKAALVFYSTEHVRRDIERHGLIDARRLVHAPYGIAPEFVGEPAQGPHGTMVAAEIGAPVLLHVGSCIARKRVDVLLDVFAAVRPRFPGIRLVKVGADWSDEQQSQIDRLRLAESIVSLRELTRSEIAALYRAAALVLLPSEAEGFGLPLIEALACGAPVVASDIPVLREVGAEAVTYCPVGDVPAWAEQVSRLLADPTSAPPRELRLSRAARFTWAAHARTIAAAYLRLTA
jgi:glycosyltransferase involved in cell wall biosynthesis